MSKLMSVKELKDKIALEESKKSAAELKAQDAAKAEKDALIERFLNPSGLTDDEASDRASIVIDRAIGNGLTAVQVLRFPNHLCTDNGRAINQLEKGWEQTLTGLPKEMYEFWKRRLQPLGYRIQFQIVDYPGGMPGDIAITLSWD